MSMLGLIGWMVYLGSGFKQAAQTQASYDRAKARAKEIGNRTYTGITGQLYLTETNQKVWRRTVCGDDCLVDKYGNTVVNFSKEVRDKKKAELLAPIRAKVEELGITDRDWLYLKDEMDWFEEYADARIDINTGMKFGVFSATALKRAENRGKYTSYTFKVANYSDGWDENARKSKIRTGASIGFYKFDINYNSEYKRIAWMLENSDRPEQKLTMYLLEQPFLSQVKEISLSDYLYKYRKPLDDVMMDFLIQTGVIESKKIEIAWNCDSDEFLAHTYLEDITKINEDKIKELALEVDKLNKCTKRGIDYETVVYKVERKYTIDNCTWYDGIDHKW